MKPRTSAYLAWVLLIGFSTFLGVLFATALTMMFNAPFPPLFIPLLGLGFGAGGAVGGVLGHIWIEVELQEIAKEARP